MVFALGATFLHLQPHTGPYGALALGWLVFAGALPAVESLKARSQGEGARCTPADVSDPSDRSDPSE